MYRWSKLFPIPKKKIIEVVSCFNQDSIFFNQWSVILITRLVKVAINYVHVLFCWLGLGLPEQEMGTVTPLGTCSRRYKIWILMTTCIYTWAWTDFPASLVPSPPSLCRLVWEQNESSFHSIQVDLGQQLRLCTQS